MKFMRGVIGKKMVINEQKINNNIRILNPRFWFYGLNRSEPGLFKKRKEGDQGKGKGKERNKEGEGLFKKRKNIIKILLFYLSLSPVLSFIIYLFVIRVFSLGRTTLTTAPTLFGLIGSSHLIFFNQRFLVFILYLFAFSFLYYLFFFFFFCCHAFRISYSSQPPSFRPLHPLSHLITFNFNQLHCFCSCPIFQPFMLDYYSLSKLSTFFFQLLGFFNFLEIPLLPFQFPAEIRVWVFAKIDDSPSFWACFAYWILNVERGRRGFWG